MTSPMLAQWRSCKNEDPSALLLFRMGDFYEAFYEDAPLLAKELCVTLTRRQDVPMAGIPHHSLETHLEKLLEKGYRVALAEQISGSVNGLMERKVVRSYTPGTGLCGLDKRQSNFMAALWSDAKAVGIAWLDIGTAEFYVCECANMHIATDLLLKIKPKELVTVEGLDMSASCTLSPLPKYLFDYKNCLHLLKEHFSLHSLDGFGLQDLHSGLCAAGALLHYCTRTLRTPLAHISKLCRVIPKNHMYVDQTTEKHLELFENISGGTQNTLFSCIDKTNTAMGSRMLRSWLLQPLFDEEQIRLRQESIEALLNAPRQLRFIKEHLDSVFDIERLVSRIALHHSLKQYRPKDAGMLLQSLDALRHIDTALAALPQNPLTLRFHALEFAKIVSLELSHFLKGVLSDELPTKLGEGLAIRPGFSAEFDRLFALRHNAATVLSSYQDRLREELGIKSLKVNFHRAFGYFIEVSRGQASAMPDAFERRQTLVNAERFTSPELKKIEEELLCAEEKLFVLEKEIFDDVSLRITAAIPSLLDLCSFYAHVDCIAALAELAKTHSLTRPSVDVSDALEIVDGRHLVVEKTTSPFTPNSTSFKNARLFLITGPNMAGKSTYIRQVALIVLLAQMGSFVPATSAHIGLIDRLFTRIGAGDDLSRGQSTFMVEMCETAKILNNITERSLIILDEIGRGTSTYDGISIAWAVAEALIKVKGTKTLFATHYSELCALENSISGVVNETVLVEENSGSLCFFHKIAKGQSKKSFGIAVAKLAGMPPHVLARAQEILSSLEDTPPKKGGGETEHPDFVTELTTIDLDTTSPRQALDILASLQAKITSLH